MVCTNQSLIDIPVNGSYYTWCNGRSRINIVERKLDGIFCNQNLLIACNSISTFTLHKLRSDHHPILLDVKFSVLSRGISKLAYDGKLDLMKTSKNIYFPSHVFNLTKLLFYVQESLLTCKSLPSYSLINLLPLVRFLAHLSLLFFRALCLIEY